MACVLCEARVKEKSRVAYEDDLVFVIANNIAMRDPHMMILPVRCVADMKDLTKEEAARVMHVSDRVMYAVDALQEDGVRLYVNGPSFRTQPQHLHIHIIPVKHSLYESYELLEGIPQRQLRPDDVLDEMAARVREKLV